MEEQLDKQIIINKLNRKIEQTNKHPYYSIDAKEAITGFLNGLLWEIEAGKYDWMEDE